MLDLPDLVGGFRFFLIVGGFERPAFQVVAVEEDGFFCGSFGGRDGDGASRGEQGECESVGAKESEHVLSPSCGSGQFGRREMRASIATSRNGEQITKYELRREHRQSQWHTMFPRGAWEREVRYVPLWCRRGGG